MHFEEGALECLNPDLTVDDQAELLPYDKKWEFPRERLKLGEEGDLRKVRLSNRKRNASSVRRDVDIPPAAVCRYVSAFQGNNWAAAPSV